MAFRWWADDGPTLNAALVALCFFRGPRPVLRKKNNCFCDFSEGGGGSRPPVPSSGSAHVNDCATGEGMYTLSAQVKCTAVCTRTVRE